MVKQKFDAVIGDTTILANRTQFVDFTMPYSESGVSMVVRVEEDKRSDMWIFLEPLSVDLWLGSLAFFVLTGFMVWVIEHRDNKEFPGRPLEQLGAIFYFAFSILVFSHSTWFLLQMIRVDFALDLISPLTPSLQRRN